MTAEPLVIIGAGPVGAVAALALHGRGVRARVLEARARGAGKDDRRAIALSWSSHLALDRLGIWRRIAAADPIERVSVSERGAFGSIEFSTADLGAPALGFVVDYGDLASASSAALDACAIPVEYGAAVTSLDADRGGVGLQIEHGGQPGERLHAECVVLADGAEGIEADTTLHRQGCAYRQVALVGEVDCERFTRARAFERFVGSGPLALLPRRDHFACVWVLEPARARALLAAHGDALDHALRAAAGPGFGALHWRGMPREVPLALRRTRASSGARVVPIGNAAQVLHPVAGQGFNLGLRDALSLAAAWPLSETSAALDRALARYRRGRRTDRGLTIAVTDAIARITAVDHPLAAAVRGLGLAGIDMLPPLRRRALQTLVFGID